jgi:hypothetical protein
MNLAIGDHLQEEAWRDDSETPRVWRRRTGVVSTHCAILPCNMRWHSSPLLRLIESRAERGSIVSCSVLGSIFPRRSFQQRQGHARY